jgi:hypothetical protein
MSEYSCLLFFPKIKAVHNNPMAAVIKKIMVLNMKGQVLKG